MTTRLSLLALPALLFLIGCGKSDTKPERRPGNVRMHQSIFENGQIQNDWFGFRLPEPAAPWEAIDPPHLKRVFFGENTSRYETTRDLSTAESITLLHLRGTPSGSHPVPPSLLFSTYNLIKQPELTTPDELLLFYSNAMKEGFEQGNRRFVTPDPPSSTVIGGKKFVHLKVELHVDKRITYQELNVCFDGQNALFLVLSYTSQSESDQLQDLLGTIEFAAKP